MGSVGSAQSAWRYPDFLLSELPVTGVKGGKKKNEEDKSGPIAKVKQVIGSKL